MELVGASRQPEQAESAEQAGPRSSVIRRARDTLACWWVLLRAHVLGAGKTDPEIEHCLQLKKGTRFYIGGGEVHFADSESRRAEGTLSSGRSRNDE